MTPFIPDANLELTEVDLTSILKSATRSKLFYACVFNLVSALILVVYNTVVKNVTNRVHGEDRDNCANVILGWVTFKFILITQTFKDAVDPGLPPPPHHPPSPAPHLAMLTYTWIFGTLALLKMFSKTAVARVRRNRMSGINPTFYNDITGLVNGTTGALGALVAVLIAR
jgi:hypothetical protein